MGKEVKFIVGDSLVFILILLPIFSIFLKPVLFVLAFKGGGSGSLVFILPKILSIIAGIILGVIWNISQKTRKVLWIIVAGLIILFVLSWLLLIVALGSGG